jgi:hypothetical protein
MLSRFVEKQQERMDEAQEAKGDLGWRAPGGMRLSELLRSAEAHLRNVDGLILARQRAIESEVPMDDEYFRERIQHEAADAANYIAMVSDRVGFNEW